MGAARPPSTRKYVLGFLGLVLLYTLFAIAFFNWSDWREGQEIAFEVMLPENSGPSMIFCAPSGWIYLNDSHRVLCYLPENDAHQAVPVKAIDCDGRVICATMAEDSLYVCASAKANSFLNSETILARLEASSGISWKCEIDMLQISPMDVAGNGDNVAVLSYGGELAYFTGQGEPVFQRELHHLQGPNGESKGLGTVNFPGVVETTTRLEMDSARTCYCLVTQDKLCAISVEGEELWQYTESGGLFDTITLKRELGQLFIYSATGNITVLDSASGEVVWKTSLSNSIHLGYACAPAVAGDGSVLFIDSNDTVCLMNQGDLKKQVSLNFFSQNFCATDKAFVAMGTDNIYVYDLEGQQKWRLDLSHSLELFSVYNTSYFYCQNLAITQDGVIVVVLDNKLTGYKPAGIDLTPAQP